MRWVNPCLIIFSNLDLYAELFDDSKARYFLFLLFHSFPVSRVSCIYLRKAFLLQKKRRFKGVKMCWSFNLGLTRITGIEGKPARGSWVWLFYTGAGDLNSDPNACMAGTDQWTHLHGPEKLHFTDKCVCIIYIKLSWGGAKRAGSERPVPWNSGKEDKGVFGESVWGSSCRYKTKEFEGCGVQWPATEGQHC